MLIFESFDTEIFTRNLLQQFYPYCDPQFQISVPPDRIRSWDIHHRKIFLYKWTVMAPHLAILTTRDWCHILSIKTGFYSPSINFQPFFL